MYVLSTNPLFLYVHVSSRQVKGPISLQIEQPRFLLSHSLRLSPEQEDDLQFELLFQVESSSHVNSN